MHVRTTDFTDFTDFTDGADHDRTADYLFQEDETARAPEAAGFFPNAHCPRSAIPPT
jgi:hypothetical protein